MLPRTHASLERLRGQLLAWFEENARPLPWRVPRFRHDPYAVLVSEVLLQQTRAEVVAPRFEDWMRRFPTVAHLARAHEDDVLAAWRGLGYYARARRLHESARILQREHGGKVPRGLAAMLALPGVGPYTAAAVASLAHGVAEPTVDGNVARVAARLEGAAVDTSDPRVRAAFVERLRPLVSGANPGALNEALIELGATVCLPRAPRCDACALAAWCTARAEGRVHLVPRSVRAPRPRKRPVLALWIERDGRVLLRRRPESGILAGQWGLPMTERGSRERAPDLARTMLQGRLVALAPRPIARVDHAFTHKRWAVSVHAARVEDRAAAGDGWRWVAPARAIGRATSTLDRRILEAVLARGLEADRTFAALK